MCRIFVIIRSAKIQFEFEVITLVADFTKVVEVTIKRVCWKTDFVFWSHIQDEIDFWSRRLVFVIVDSLEWVSEPRLVCDVRKSPPSSSFDYLSVIEWLRWTEDQWEKCRLWRWRRRAWWRREWEFQRNQNAIFDSRLCDRLWEWSGRCLVL